MILSADDVPGDLAERYGYVNRSLPDADLDGFVYALATRIASFRANRQSWIPSAWSTLLVCRLISKSNPGGGCVPDGFDGTTGYAAEESKSLR